MELTLLALIPRQVALSLPSGFVHFENTQLIPRQHPHIYKQTRTVLLLLNATDLKAKTHLEDIMEIAANSKC